MDEQPRPQPPPNQDNAATPSRDRLQDVAGWQVHKCLEDSQWSAVETRSSLLGSVQVRVQRKLHVSEYQLPAPGVEEVQRQRQSANDRNISHEVHRASLFSFRRR